MIVKKDDGYFRTANLFIKREVFDAVGGFEDWIVESGGDPPFGWRAPADGRATQPARKSIGEDSLLGWEARRLGARAVFAPDALVTTRSSRALPGAPPVTAALWPPIPASPLDPDYVCLSSWAAASSAAAPPS